MDEYFIVDVKNGTIVYRSDNLKSAYCHLIRDNLNKARFFIYKKINSEKIQVSEGV